METLRRQQWQAGGFLYSPAAPAPSRHRPPPAASLRPRSARFTSRRPGHAGPFRCEGPAPGNLIYKVLKKVSLVPAVPPRRRPRPAAPAPSLHRPPPARDPQAAGGSLHVPAPASRSPGPRRRGPALRGPSCRTARHGPTQLTYVHSSGGAVYICKPLIINIL